ncbi:response regulator [Bermanella marisrubri]|uniref:histidine kinase n=1 Tax=Bermanella marisrubri TaxID=207949 RepID=Q1N3K5_9GAMM|nr:response regulator [Bermanella marisrubri]EAT12869.1 Periplasmic Sensor Hybrid Histidine Kinase [Oceanobacter sp. RED65] [Bermanella marisrubri]QIZ83190.1 response regulator [Bermanella marisrubri]
MIRLLLSLLFFLNGILVTLPVYSADGTKHRTTIILADGPINIEFSNFIEYLHADAHAFSLSQLQTQTTDKFSPIQDSLVLKANEPYWLRFHISNPTKKVLPLALSLSDKAVQINGAYIYNNNQWQLYPEVNRQTLLSNYQALVINIQAKSEQWFYLRVKANKTTPITPQLRDLQHHNNAFTVVQQVYAINVALLVFIALLHVAALRFHHHVRHYIVVYMALVGALFAVSHSPLINWPQWMLAASDLSPWLVSCGLALSSFSTAFYRRHLRTNRSWMVVMMLVLLTLFIVSLSYTAQLFIALLPLLFIIVFSKPRSISFILACLILTSSIAWQIGYVLWPESLVASTGIMDILALSSSILLASFSMTLPYFKRQVRLKTPNNNIRHAQFLSKLTHELRTPMNGVLGMEELLLETNLSAKQKDYVETIGVAGEDMVRLVNRVSDYAKLLTGRFRANNEAMNLADIIDQIIAKFQLVIHQKNIELVINLDPNLPEFIECDEKHLTSILENLLEHGINRTEHGEVELRVTWSEHQHLFFSVRDTGKGIKKETLKTLFDDKIHLSHIHDVSSAGFSLVLSKQLIEHLGGNLFVDNQTGEGSTISFTLPYKVAREYKEKNPLESLLKGLSILIVDDNSTLRKVLQRYAKSWGMHAETTHSGKEALAKLRSQTNLDDPFDIILIDQDMPIMNGFELARRISNDNEINQELVKIMLTGLSIDQHAPELRDTGIQQLLTKPISANALKQHLATHIEKKLEMQ